MENNNNKVKLNMTVAPELKEYLIKQADCFGMSVSAYLTMIVQTYRTQTKALEEISKVQSYIDQFQNMMIDAKKLEKK
jgi:hypothetical protein